MQPNALNLAIAQSIEKNPERTPLGTGYVVTAAWQYNFITCLWKPRDFINDPSLSFLLLKRLAEEGDEPRLQYETDTRGWVVSSGYTEPAIAEYYARAKGIYVDDK